MKPEPISDEEWASLLTGERDIKSISKDRIRQAIIDGIPIPIRGEVWCLLCGFKQDEENHHPDLYHKLLDMENSYDSYLIGKDVFRTLPD